MPDGFLPPVVAVLLGNISDFSAKMGEAKGEMGAVEGSASKMGALGKLALVGLAAGAVAVGVESVKMASSFKSTMELIATQAHAGQQEVDNMSKAVLALAPTVGIGPEKLAEGLYHVESTGLRGSAALDVVKASAQEAAIGMADFDDVTYAMSGVMSVALKDVQNAADGVAYLNTIVGTGDMRMGDLAKAIGTGVLPVFKSAQLGMRDFGSAMAVMTDNSMPAEQAANHLKTAVMLLQNQSGPAAKALASIGIQTGQLATDLAKPDGFLVAIQDIKKHLEESGKSAVEQGQIIAKAFGGARSAATIEEFIGQIDKLKGKYQEMGKVSERAKQQQEDWAATQQTFKQKMAEVGAQFQVWFIEIGTKLLPVLSKMADMFMSTVNWLGSHKDVLVAIGSLLLPLLAYGLGLVTIAVWDFTVALLANPITWIVLLIGGLIFGLYELLTHLTEVGHFFSWLWNTVWKWTSDRVTDIVNFLVSTFDTVIGWIVARWNDFTGFWADLWNTVWKWCSDRISDVVNFVTSTFNGVVDWIVSAWEGIPGFFSNLWGKVVDFFTGLPGKLGYALGYMIGTVIKWAIDLGAAVGRGVRNVITWFESLPTKIATLLSNIGTWLTQKGSDLLHGLWSGITTAWNAVMQWFHDLPAKVGAFFSTVGTWLLDKGDSLINGLLDGIVNIYNDVTAWFHALPGRIKDFLATAGTWLLEHGKSLINGLGNGIVEAAKAVWQWLQDLPGVVGRFFAGIGSWLYNAGRDLLQGLLNGIISMGSWLWDQVTSWAHGLVQGIKDALGISSPSIHTHEMGRFLVEGLANGIDDHAYLAVSAMQAMGKKVLGAGATVGFGGGSLAVTGSLSPAALSASIGGGGGTVVNNITVQGTVIAEQQLMQLVQEKTLQLAARNSTNGLSLGLATGGR